ncbi:hypothetical protein SISNIDRAFT_221095 [Sistotremastrum niveocremeum HHB9708]|uniref:Uncharacterized protein n=1 Tax=Sistotremastrum niveocremeum HHB9708 TaxID=1314777 RepID=A0A164QLJ9_9AGAM|nr:hypothetical protein SISNIDRAFT_221095 [Sistotremastrum niveocremeum HHB9708]
MPIRHLLPACPDGAKYACQGVRRRTFCLTLSSIFSDHIVPSSHPHLLSWSGIENLFRRHSRSAMFLWLCYHTIPSFFPFGIIL